MSPDNMSDRLREYLQKIKDTKDDKCWFCNKTPDKIRKEFFDFKKSHAGKKLQHIDIEDLLIMTYKTKKPVCAACYFAIKQNPKLIAEILENPEEDIWG